MMRPNLFSYATSELSQDAVLCWLIAWADSRYADLDPALHAAGTALLSTILGKWGHALPDGPLTTSAQRQVEHVDVVARVGTEFLIGIEDKTNSGPHNDLIHYKRTLDAIGAKENLVVLPIYVKTGERNEDAFVRAKGWEILGRAELLVIVEQAQQQGPRNAILSDFGDYLARQEADATAWRRVLPSGTWPWNAWKGFYGALEERMPWARWIGWDYVANPAGGFLAMWWGFYPVDDGDLYLQLQHGTLAVRFKVKAPERRRQLVQHWSDRVRGNPPPGVPLIRPRRLGHGEHVAIAYWNGWRVAGADGLVDVEATARHLQEIDVWLQAHAAGA
jgi:hypothetical protein